MIENKENINDFDLMMKSILDEEREEVPVRVWEGVSAGLDKAARRKTVVLWWRRAAAGVAAAAAVTVGIIFNMDKGTDSLVPHVADNDMIDVVESVEIAETVRKMTTVLIAEAEVPAEIPSDIIPETASEAIETVSEPVSDNTAVRSGQKKETVKEEPVYFPEDWGEEEVKTARRVALVLSGIASTNNTASQNGINPMKRPTMSPAPTKTGIEETSTKASYGIPASFGAGVKVDLNPRWSIGAGINYTRLSRQFYGKYTKVGADGSIENSTSSDIRNIQHYVGVPVNAFYDIMSNDRIDLYAYIGGTVEKCISDNYSVLSTTITHIEKPAGVQLSANAGIGVEFALGKHIGLYLDPSLRYYFNNGQPKSIRTVQPLMLGFEMGFRARL